MHWLVSIRRQGDPIGMRPASKLRSVLSFGRWVGPPVLGVAFGALLAPAGAQPTFEERRAAMVAEIADDVARTAEYTGRANLAPAVTAALLAVPRHEFVPPALVELAYANRPLPIGAGQTISQPYIVALMTDLAAVDDASVVLEVGTGSGYQAAVLAEIAAQVYTIEIVEELGRRAEAVLRRLGYGNVTVSIGDGYRGWPEKAPFDAILVTAAPEEVPQALLEQLKPGGRLVIPVGAEGETQSLRLLEKTLGGEIREREILPVRFVPLVREP